MKCIARILLILSVILSVPVMAQDNCSVVVIKPIKQFLVRSQRRCFESRRAAENKGNSPYIVPTPTPSPSPSATPVDFSDSYTGDLTVASDTCDDLAGATIPAVGTFSLVRNVTNEGAVVFGIDSDGRRAAGSASTGTFTLRDTNFFEDCPNGEAELTEVFTVVADDATMFTVVRTNAVTCPGVGTCTQSWSGTVTRQ